MDGEKGFDLSVFRTYDIRGIYPKDIDEGFAKGIGRAFGTLMGIGKTIAVSSDVRKSSNSLEKSLIEGLLETGAKIQYIGVVPTPILYFAIAHYNMDGGIMVSASHNPAEWNGFKVCGARAKILSYGKGLEKVKDVMVKGEFAKSDNGSLEDIAPKVLRDYEAFVSSRIKVGPGLRVGVDPGNGTSAEFSTGIMRRLGIEVVPINDNRDGAFPSRSPEANAESITELINLVKDKKLDMGVAFDGDADRVMFVDDTGRVLHGDKMLAILVKNTLKPGERVVYEVTCTDALLDMIKAKEGVPFMTRVGRSFIADTMVEQDAVMGAEISGHMYFRDMYYFDDPLFATLMVAKLLSDSKKRLSALADELPQYSKYAASFDVEDSLKFKVVDEIAKNIRAKGGKVVELDGIKVIEPTGWYLLRVSNTTPLVRIAVEAKNENDLKRLTDSAEKEFRAAYESCGKA